MLSEFIHKAVEQEGMPDCDDMVTLALAKELECHFVSNDQYRDFQVRQLTHAALHQRSTKSVSTSAHQLGDALNCGASRSGVVALSLQHGTPKPVKNDMSAIASMPRHMDLSSPRKAFVLVTMITSSRLNIARSSIWLFDETVSRLCSNQCSTV